MARVLAYTSPARGHLYPLTPILDQLHARGHEIALRTLGSEVSTMQSRGFETTAISESVESIEHEDFTARNSRAALAKAVDTFADRAAFDAPDLQMAVEKERPDALIVDINSWGAAAVAEASGLPWAMFSPYALALRSKDAPPFGPGLPPASGPLGRLRDRLVEPLIFGAIENQMLPRINEIRRDLQLDPFSRIDEIVTSAPLLLYMTAEPFEYPRSDWPAGVVMVGPCAWEPPAPEPVWLAEIDRPIVLVTTSSEFQDDGKLVATALRALADEPFAVIATVPAADPSDFDVPANARVERFLPHGQVLDRAICAVTHGGMGATQKALSRGVPVCAVPFGRDQREVARRVEVAGAGSRLSERRLSVGRLREKVHEAIANAAGARTISTAYEATGGPNAAAEHIERQLPQGADKPVLA